MPHLTNIPQWVITICSLFCLKQVMSWFEEIIESMNENTSRFFWMGKRYDILPNKSFIVDESLKVYGYGLVNNKNLQLN